MRSRLDVHGQTHAARTWPISSFNFSSIVGSLRYCTYLGIGIIDFGALFQIFWFRYVISALVVLKVQLMQGPVAARLAHIFSPLSLQSIGLSDDSRNILLPPGYGSNDVSVFKCLFLGFLLFEEPHTQLEVN